MRRLLRIGTGWLIALAMLVLLHPLPVRAAASNLVIVFTADTDGEIDPCGCPGNPIGGFARRATLYRQIAQSGDPLLILDAGNALLKGARVLEPDPKRNAAHAAFMATLLARVGTRALAVGPRDLWAAGLPGLQAQAREKKLLWLSANVLGPRGGMPFPASTVLRAGGLRVGVIGLTEPQEMVGRKTGVTFLDPVVATRPQVNRLHGQVDLIIVLSNLPIEQNDLLREQVPGIDLILSGAPTEGGGALVNGTRAPWDIRVHGEGRNIGRLDLRLTPGSRRPLQRSEAMERRLAELEATQSTLKALREQIVQEEGRFNQARFEAEGDFLRERLELLRRDPERVLKDIRAFAHRELPLLEEIPDDAWIAARVKAYTASAGTSTSGPQMREAAPLPPVEPGSRPRSRR
jgi:2',3'-cyclic-nucleotide 2'-phosphodiesterase (5'-nucleotidase family)